MVKIKWNKINNYTKYLLGLVFGLLLLGSVIGMQESFASEGCGLYAEVHWDAFNDIYTGKVISVTVRNHSPFKLSELYPDATIEIKISNNFEFVDVPAERITTSDDYRHLSYRENLV